MLPTAVSKSVAEAMLVMVTPVRCWWQQRTAASLVLQTAFRARCAWRARKLRQVALLRMQATLRCFLEQQRLWSLQRIDAAIALQTGFRRWRCELAYRVARQSILAVQNSFRDWIARRAARRRAEREGECWLAAAKVLLELGEAGIGQDVDTDATATDATATMTFSRSSCEEDRSRQSSPRGVNSSSTDQQSEADSSACSMEEPGCEDSHAASKNLEAEHDILPEIELAHEVQETPFQRQTSMVRLRRPLPIPIAFQACPDKEPLFATPVLSAEIAKPSEGPLNFSDVTLEPRGSDVDRPSGEAALVALLELQRAACDWGLPEAAKAARDAAVTVASPSPSALRQLPDLHMCGDSRKVPESPAPSTGSALHAARQLRISQQGAGYTQPTASSEARWSERKAVVAALKEAKGEPLPASPTVRLNITCPADMLMSGLRWAGQGARVSGILWEPAKISYRNFWNAIFDFTGKADGANWRILPLGECCELDVRTEESSGGYQCPSAPLSHALLCQAPLRSDEGSGQSLVDLPQTRPALPAHTGASAQRRMIADRAPTEAAAAAAPGPMSNATGKEGKPKLRKPRFIEVNRLNPDSRGVNVFAKVVQVSPVASDLAEVVLGDASARVTFRARGDQVQLCQPGSILRIQNALVVMVKGYIRLEVNKWGVAKPAPDHADFEVAALDISAVEYELAQA
ncbi:unnamed protein product [Symbiodinium microadriaticum]|nr:unnamed protein product [Symbiodinium microadriaticum]